MNDSAVRTLQNAIKEKPVLDDEKKDLIYHLGCVFEKMEKKAEAIEQFAAGPRTETLITVDARRHTLTTGKEFSAMFTPAEFTSIRAARLVPGPSRPAGRRQAADCAPRTVAAVASMTKGKRPHSGAIRKNGFCTEDGSRSSSAPWPK